jgi:hypothetical protein
MREHSAESRFEDNTVAASSKTALGACHDGYSRLDFQCSIDFRKNSGRAEATELERFLFLASIVSSSVWFFAIKKPQN